MILSAFQPRGLAEHYVVAMVTSQLSGLVFPGDTVLVKWSEAGLPKPSLVRLAKVVTVDGSLIRRKLGMLPESDRKVIRRTIPAGVLGTCLRAERGERGFLGPKTKVKPAALMYKTSDPLLQFRENCRAPGSGWLRRARNE